MKETVFRNGKILTQTLRINVQLAGYGYGAPGGILMDFNHFEPAPMAVSSSPRGHDP